MELRSTKGFDLHGLEFQGWLQLIKEFNLNEINK